jgi:hypothetical protein
MVPHTFATGGGFPDVSQLLLGAHMDSACAPYGKCGAQADQSAQRGRQDRPVIASPAGFWTRSTIRRRTGLKASLCTQHAHIPCRCSVVAGMPLIRVVHIAPVTRGFHGRMRRVRATCKAQRRSSVRNNHAAGMTPQIGAANLPRRRSSSPATFFSKAFFQIH